MKNPKLAFENDAVLSLVQALLAKVSKRMLGVAISVEHPSPSIGVYFAFTEVTEHDRELIDDIVSDLSSLIGTHIPITRHVWIGLSRSKDWPGRDQRLVYATSAADPGSEEPTK